MARVLAVDDDLTVLTLIRRFLKTAGHEVLMARDGDDALTQLRASRPDVVVCDVNMPGKSGFEVLEAIRADPEFGAQPFVLLTSEDDRDSIRRGMRLGADDFLSKPADSAELVESIVRVLDKRRRLSSLMAATALSSSGEMRAHYASALTQSEGTALALPHFSADLDEITQPDASAYLHRVVELRTIVACGIEDFAALSGRLQSEQLSALLDSYLQTTIQSILAQGGQVLKLMGDNVVAVFGHQPGDTPSAAARAALRAAIEIVQNAASENLESTLPRSMKVPQFRVIAGVHSGQVVLAEAAEDTSGSLSISGEGIDVACALRDRAMTLRWLIVASTAAIEVAGPNSGIDAGPPQSIESGAGRRPLRVQQLRFPAPSAKSAKGAATAAPGVALNAALAAVLHENARSGAQASKEALDAALEAINDAQSAEFEVVPQASGARPQNRLPPIRGYRIERKIGEGGMSTVYLAESDAREGKVVLKVLKGRRGDDEALWARFFQECAILSSIKHEHVVRIFDQGFGDEFAYIAMEYLAGGGLAELIRVGVTPRQAMSLLSQAAGALAEIHQRGILHRDIKPANFLLRAQSVLVLTDFGVAKRVGQRASHTIQGEVLGTPHYVSPEQAQGGLVTPASDIYGLGVIFHELLCGRRPFDGETLMEILSQHLTAPIPRMPADLAEYQPLIDGMLAKIPEERLGSAHAVLEEIDRVWTAQAVRKMKM